MSAPIDIHPNFLSPTEADALFKASKQLAWQQNKIRMFGKPLDLPRLEAIYGDDGCSYYYSNSVLLEPLPWVEPLQQLRHKVQELTGYEFQIVIGNYYRSGADHIGWHSDDSPEMGENPAIASVSLGATRKFGLRDRETKETEWLELTNGSLLLMRPSCQTTHVHCIAKTSKPVEERINWTFRPHVGSKVMVATKSRRKEKPVTNGSNDGDFKAGDPRTIKGACVKVPSGDRAYVDGIHPHDPNRILLTYESGLGRDSYPLHMLTLVHESREAGSQIGTEFKVGDLLETDDGYLAIIESYDRDGFTLTLSNGKYLEGSGTDLERWGYRKLWSEGDRVTPKHNPDSRYGIITGFNIKNKKTPLLIRFDGSNTEGKWGKDAVVIAKSNSTAIAPETAQSLAEAGLQICKPNLSSEDIEQGLQEGWLAPMPSPETSTLDTLIADINTLYGNLEEAEEVRESAEFSAFQFALEMGYKLIQAKKEAGHGNWEKIRSQIKSPRSGKPLPSSTATLYQRMAQRKPELEQEKIKTLRGASEFLKSDRTLSATKTKSATVAEMPNESNSSIQTGSLGSAADSTANARFNNAGDSQSLGEGERESQNTKSSLVVAEPGLGSADTRDDSTSLESTGEAVDPYAYSPLPTPMPVRFRYVNDWIEGQAIAINGRSMVLVVYGEDQECKVPDSRVEWLSDEQEQPIQFSDEPEQALNPDQLFDLGRLRELIERLGASVVAREAIGYCNSNELDDLRVLINSVEIEEAA